MAKTNQEERRKAPILRFKGFTNDWEQRKLDKIVSIKSGWSPSKFIHLKKSDELFIKVDDLNYSDKIQTDSKLKVETNFNIEKIKKNSIIFPKRGVAIKTNKVRILGKESYIDTNIMALQTNEINYSFLYNLILKIGLYKIADTSTIPQINNKHINSYKIHFPKFDKEQQKIGNFIDVLDYLIALYERKVKLLSQVKKYFLNNLFAKNEYPNLRFKGFTNAWEQRKFKEILITYPFKQYIKEPQKNGSYKVIQQGNSPIIGYANGEPFQNYTNVVLFGDHTVSLYNPHAPFFIATDGVKILGTNLNFNGDFLYCILEKYKPKSQGYKRHYSILKNQKMYFTKNNKEQNEISNLMETLNYALLLYENKLKQIKKIKKELLDTMFI